ncbi:hypothetical protein [Vibrio fluvialis]|uniref:hypothetical protein n=1 Tax=Vibrio fluvialis TaxID=676 RepID=UPI0028DFB941|nr:hypothetical protein [Vibrio fluvialis]MDT8865847.1 hypothetical protein [Vibrio fluvialis]MDT8873615.1 hypothetical protein [Vibrio fluvialis]
MTKQITALVVITAIVALLTIGWQSFRAWQYSSQIEYYQQRNDALERLTSSLQNEITVLAILAPKSAENALQAQQR